MLTCFATSTSIFIVQSLGHVSSTSMRLATSSFVLFSSHHSAISLSLSFVNYTLSGRIPGICLNHLEFVSSFFHSSALQRYSCGESCGEVQCFCERSLMRSIETLAPSKPSANLKILAGLPRCKHLFCLHLTIYSQG